MEITLRPWRADDLAALVPLADDPRVARNLRDAFPSPYSEADGRAFLELCAQLEPPQALFLAVTADGALAGGIGLTFGADVARKSAELGYWLGEPFWGRGIASAAVRQICARGFGEYGLVRIYAEPFAYNKASQRVLEKCGFEREGVLRKSVLKNGEFYDSMLYALVK